MSPRVIATFIVSGLAIFGLFKLLPNNPRASVVLAQHPAQREKSPLLASDPDLNAKPAKPEALEGSTPEWSQMDKRFRSDQNLRSFIQDALHKPKQGGYFYAANAYNYCRAIVGVHLGPASEKDSPAVSKARRDLQNQQLRCDGVRDQFGDDAIAFYRTMTGVDAGADPLMPGKGRGVTAPSDQSLADSDLRTAMRTGNGYAVAAVLDANMEYFERSWLGPQYSASEDEIYFKAISLIECGLRSDCDSNTLLFTRCTLAKDCVGDMRTLLLEGMDAAAISRENEVEAIFKSKILEFQRD